MNLLFLSAITLIKIITSTSCNEISIMAKPRVLIGSSEVPKKALDLLRSKCNLTIMADPLPEREDVLKTIPGHAGFFLVTHKNFVNSEFLNRAGPELKVISTMSAGHDHLDVPEIKKRGIKVGHTPEVLSSAVAEIAVLLMLDAARRGYEGRLKLNEGNVERGIHWLLGQEIRGSTVGIVGLGSIGKEIVKHLNGFHVSHFLYTGRSKKKEGDELGAMFVSLDELLRQSDFVFVVVPLTNDTKEMFNDEAFAKMKKTAVFVNVGRGAVVKTDSLVRALKNRTIFAAGLDVTSPEPLPADHELLKLPNAVVIPHLGSATEKTRTEMAVIAAQNILNGLDGKPLVHEL